LTTTNKYIINKITRYYQLNDVLHKVTRHFPHQCREIIDQEMRDIQEEVTRIVENIEETETKET